MSYRRAGGSRPVLVLEANDFVGFANCDLPYAVGQERFRVEDVLRQSVDELEREWQVEVRTNQSVGSVDPARGEVSVESDSGTDRVEYDRLVLATGARPRWPDYLPEPCPRISPLNQPRDVTRINRNLDRSDDLIILGGGYIGLEAAAGLAEKGYSVTLLEAGRLAEDFGSPVREHLNTLLEQIGVDVVTGCSVDQVSANGRGVRVQCGSRSDRADRLLACLGVEARSDVLSEPSQRRGPRGGLVVDPYMRTEVPNVFAVGDVTARRQIDGSLGFWAQASTAAADGWVVGTSLAGQRVRRQPTLRPVGFRLRDQRFVRFGKSADEMAPAYKRYSHTFHDSRGEGSVALYVGPEGRVVGVEGRGAHEGLGELIGPAAPIIRNRGSVEELTQQPVPYHPDLPGSLNHPIGVLARRVVQGRS